MRLVWIGFGLAAVLAAQGPEPRGPLPLTLKRAVELAVAPEGNTAVQLSGETLAQAEARSRQARSALLPNLDGTLSRRDQTTNLAAVGLKFSSPIPGFQFPTLVGPYGVTDARLSVGQTVFDFSSIRRFQASKAGVAAARSDVDSTRRNRWPRRWPGPTWRRCARDADVEARRPTWTLAEAVLKQAENQKAAGTGTGIEITRARVQLANDRQRLLVARERAPQRAPATAARHGPAAGYGLAIDRQAGVCAGGRGDAGAGQGARR